MYSAISANKRNTVIIMAVFLLIIAGLGWLAGAAYNNVGITWIVIAVASVYALIQYFAASRLALAVNGAHQIEKRDAPELYRIVENLAITDGLPMPKVYIMDDPAPNAFATGRNPDNASVAVTTGLLQIMDKRELAAVLAHEMGHVKNYDILVNMIVFGLVSAIGMICDMIMRVAFWGDNKDRDSRLMIFGIIAAILAPIVAMMVQLAVSRQREYLADASGALTTRDPEGLAMALEKLKDSSKPMRNQNSSTAHLFFANPLKPGFLSKLFSTHPPLDDRIARLRQNATKM
ncbi:MAG TPA: M48 family metalloprotease [Candidatus Nanoperiomorbaceae bacterium]|nr:M48 family metalloprotease [Candidatus Nanoperiomorbaceae bacterium]HMQ97019.1 M48 family metalloprotease [Candidatus Nanoperiomorbaceae bacterium]HMR86295.1 M48 family metalloprotease [Candidatus Nanoperiomorbaceae bacterium]